MTSEREAPQVPSATAFRQAATNQRRALLLALGLVAAALIVAGSNGAWAIGAFIALGVLLGALNALLTETSLVRMARSGGEFSRQQFAMSALFRLLAISLVAFAVAAIFWPTGATVLLGLAVFQLLNVFFTGYPLLREMRKA